VISPSHTETRRAQAASPPQFFFLVDNAFDPVFHRSRSEIDQQSEFVIRQPQIREQLLVVSRIKGFYGFDFNYDRVLDQQVDFEATVEPQTFKIKGNRLLPFHVEAGAGHVSREHRFVDGFKQPWSEFRTNSIRGVNDRTGNPIQIIHKNPVAPQAPVPPVFLCENDLAATLGAKR
jgi:hypothetical protein